MEWYPRYPALWKADTMHLDPFQDGCYLRLIDHYMETRQPLPDNDAALARIIGISIDQWVSNASSIVKALFKHSTPGKLTHTRCDLVLAEQDTRSGAYSERAKKGAQARWQKDQSNQRPASFKDASSIAKPMLEPATGQDKTGHNKELTNVSSSARGIRLPADWVLPDEWSDWAFSHGLTRERIEREAAYFGDFWRAKPGRDGVKTDWQAVWRNWVRRASERQPTEMTQQQRWHKNAQRALM